MKEGSMLDRLFVSLEELEDAINAAKRLIALNPYVSETILTRLDAYDEALEKQRNLALDLHGAVKEGNASEITRIISLINGLSVLIRDDAREILCTLSDRGVEVQIPAGLGKTS